MESLCLLCYNNLKAGPGFILPIGTRKMEYKGSSWHETCFICHRCQQPIGTKSFIPKDNQNFCVPCYEKQFAMQCVQCKKVKFIMVWNTYFVCFSSLSKPIVPGYYPTITCPFFCLSSYWKIDWSKIKPFLFMIYSNCGRGISPEKVTGRKACLCCALSVSHYNHSTKQYFSTLVT